MKGNPAVSRDFSALRKNRYFEVLGGLNVENRSDDKVAMLSEIDMTSVEAIRARFAAEGKIKPSYTAFVASAVSQTLVDQPHANRIPIELPFRKRIVQLHRVDMTVAVEMDEPGLEQAVYAGTIRNSDQLGLGEMTAQLRTLATATEESSRRWKTLKNIVERLPTRLARWVLTVPKWSAKLWVEHRGGSVMISSPAKYGVDIMVGAWPWPLGFSFGLVKPRAVAVDNEVVVRPTMMLTMSFDRRLMGGAPAARFFNAVCAKLRDAENALKA